MTSLWRFLVINEVTGITLQIDAVKPVKGRGAFAYMDTLYRRHGEPGVVVQGERWDGEHWERYQKRFKK